MILFAFFSQLPEPTRDLHVRFRKKSIFLGVSRNAEQRDRMTSGHNKEDAARIEALIDRNLKLVYSDLVQEDLPDRFKDLLAVLKAQDAEGKETE